MSDLDLMEAQIEDLQRRISDLEARLCPAPPSIDVVGNEARALLCIDAVCAIWGVTSAEIRARPKPKRLVQPRSAAMWLVRTQTELSFSEIGRLFGRDHSTVQAACKKVPGLIESDPNFRARLEAADKWIGGAQLEEKFEASPSGGRNGPDQEVIADVLAWLRLHGDDNARFFADGIERGEHEGARLRERRTG